MKKLIVFFSVILLTGCMTVKETIYLQNAKVYGPISSPPQPLLDGKHNENIVITPRISINPYTNMTGLYNHSKVGPYGEFLVDTIVNSDGSFTFKEGKNNSYSYKGRNVQWEYSDISAGLDFFIPASKGFAFIGSVSVAKGNEITLYGGSAGIQLMSNNNDKLNFSMAFGIHLQDMAYEATSIVVTETKYLGGSTSKDITFYRDSGSDNSLNVFVTLSFSSFSETLPGFYLNTSYFSQTVLDFEPQDIDPSYLEFYGVNYHRVDTRGTTTLHFLNINPGMYLNVFDNLRVNVGTKLLYELGLENSNHIFIIQPELRFGLIF